MPPLPEASGTFTLQAEVPSGLVEGAREAPVEGHLLAIPQDHLVQRADSMGSFIHGLQDQFPWEGAQLEEGLLQPDGVTETSLSSQQPGAHAEVMLLRRQDKGAPGLPLGAL